MTKIEMRKVTGSANAIKIDEHLLVKSPVIWGDEADNGLVKRKEVSVVDDEFYLIRYYWDILAGGVYTLTKYLNGEEESTAFKTSSELLEAECFLIVDGGYRKEVVA